MSQISMDSTGVAQSWQSSSPSVPIDTQAEEAANRSLEENVADESTAYELGLRQKLAGRRRRVVCPCPAWKRTMDVTLGGVLLVLLLPALLAVALFIKCVSRGPVLFRQRRYGLGGRPFKMWKFRTMEVSPECRQHLSHVADLMANDGTLQKRDDQLQIIPGGRLLRKLGIDELPQLLNVLKGEMSLVGPRPDVVPFNNYASRHRRRFDVLPGITGLWQVSGKNSTTFTRMMQLDVAYVRRRSFWLDVAILLMTIPAIASE